MKYRYTLGNGMEVEFGEKRMAFVVPADGVKTAMNIGGRGRRWDVTFRIRLVEGRLKRKLQKHNIAMPHVHYASPQERLAILSMMLEEVEMQWEI